VTWKHNIQLRDLNDDQPLEATCKICGFVRYEVPSVLLLDDDLRDAYLNEVEVVLRCNARGCNGCVRIAIATDAETEGFMGGLP